MGLYILCPYFRRERKLSITCEDTIRSYPSSREKNKVLKTYCSDSWKGCPFASRLERIYAKDLTDKELKENIMENTIEQQKTEINKLMRENGQLKKKVETLKKQIEDRDEVAAKNHEMYMKSLKRKDELLKAKDEQTKWLESLAAAFLVVAYGNDTREVTMSKDKILKLMTEYHLSYYPAEDGESFKFSFEHITGAKS